MNTKKIQANQFEKDKTNSKARALQLDFAMGYECENHNEVQSALWSRGSEVPDVLAYDIVASAMHCSGKHFKWSERKDEIVHKFENFGSKIKPITVAGS